MPKKITVTINKNILTNSMSEGRNGISVSRAIKEVWENKVRDAQMELVSSFQQDPVTVEIDAGVDASNISGTLNGKGNLFSFIGFDKGSNPTDEIKKLLKDKINIKVKTLSFGRFNISIDAPSKEEIYAVSPIPWNPGRSWVDGIEKGISGIGSYVYKDSEASRSGKGIQTNTSLGGRFSNRTYMSTLLKEFERKVSK